MLSLAEIQMLAYADAAARVRTPLKPESDVQAVVRVFGRDRSWRHTKTVEQHKTEIRDIKYGN